MGLELQGGLSSSVAKVGVPEMIKPAEINVNAVTVVLCTGMHHTSIHCHMF